MNIKKDYGSIGRYQVRLLSWSQEEAKKVPAVLFTEQDVLDIRCYDSEDTPKQGITLNADMITSLYTILSRITPSVTDEEKARPLKVGAQQGMEYTLYNIYGTLQIMPQYNVVFSTAKYGGRDAEIVCDIRIWSKDLSAFSFGISIPIEEFGAKFSEMLLQVCNEMDIAYPRMLSCRDEDDPFSVCINELIYQLDKTALCFGKGNEATYKKLYAETLDFIRNWGTGKPSYVAKRI